MQEANSGRPRFLTLQDRRQMPSWRAHPWT